MNLTGFRPPGLGTRSRRHALREAKLAQGLTIAWMVVEGVPALGAGVAAHSVALTAFGADSGIELFSAVVVLRHLLSRSEHEEPGGPAAAERQATRLVGWALYALLAYIVVSAGASAVFRLEPAPSPAGAALAATSLLIMAGLWRWRAALAERLKSPALSGDAACSLVCVYMAGTTLTGLLANQLFGFWWADPLAALALVWWVRSEAKEAMTSARTG